MENLNKSKVIIVIFLLSFFGLMIRFLIGNYSLLGDEIATLVTSVQSFPSGIIDALMTKNLHAPLYYFILHFWIKFFGDSEFSLRFLPILLGTSCIPVAYMCGRTLISKNAGIICSILVTINFFMILYSHFCKFYAFLEFLSFLSLYFLIKFNQNFKEKYIIWLAVVNSLIIYTYVLGFLFVFCLMFSYIAYLFFIKKYKNFRFLIKYIIVLIILILPFFPFLYTVIKNTQQPLTSGFFWYKFDFTHIFSVLFTWFSPVLPSFLSNEKHVELTRGIDCNYLSFIIFNLIPFLVMVLGIVYTALKKNMASCLLFSTLLFVFIEYIAAMMGRCSFVGRSTLLVLPAVIIAIAYWLSELKNKNISYYILIILFLINYLYLFVSDQFSYQNSVRSDIYSVVEKLQYSDINEGDVIILPIRGYYITYFYKPKNVKIISLDMNYGWRIQDKKFLSEIFSSDDIDFNKHNLIERYFRYIRNDSPTLAITNYLNEAVFKDLNPLNKIIVVTPVLGTDKMALNNVLDNKISIDKYDLYEFIQVKICYDILKVIENHKYILSNYDSLDNYNIYTYKILTGEKKNAIKP